MEGNDESGNRHIPQVAQTRLLPNQVSSEHHHKDMTELFYFLEGEATMTVNGKAMVVKKGTCVCVEPYDTHEIVNTHPTMPCDIFYFGVITGDPRASETVPPSS